MEILERKYNIIPIHIEELDGDVNYSNRKYLVTDKNGIRYIFKIYTDPDELKYAREECRILNQISNRLPFNVPETIPNIDGELFTITGKGEARLLKYIEGSFISDITQTDKLIYLLGRDIGVLHNQLKTIESDILKGRKLFWDLQYGQLSVNKTRYIQDPSDRKIVNYFLDRFQTEVVPEMHTLRHSYIHGDLNDNNILVKNNSISGIIDFGDSSYSPLINELAIAATYIMTGKSNPVESVLPLVKGFNEIVGLTKQEVYLLPDLITTRLSISVCNSAEKRATGMDNEYVLISEKPAWDLLRKWMTFSPVMFLNRLLDTTGLTPGDSVVNQEHTIIKRNKYISKALSLSYSTPIYMERALFQYMYDRQGNTYLDAYNNIPHVGHSHPHVQKAISRQSKKLNTNTRYLYDSLIDYSEKLLHYFPEKLTKVFYVNSGSAASDLAIRIARNYTNRSHMLVMDHGYHGNTTTGIEVSPYKFDGQGGRGLPRGITTLPLPNMYRATQSSGEEYAAEARSTIERLIFNNTTPAAFIAEPVSGCGGQVPLADNYLRLLYPFLKEHGILTISDEVQVGFGRLGDWFWGFEMHNIEPDIVILGKPMGNGHPIGAVVTTAEIADSFATGMEFFSSFGGNPVSCEAARAVLEVIEDEKLQQNASSVGSYYLDSALQLKSIHPVIGDVRGSGLFIGIEFTLEDGNPGTIVANRVKNSLKDLRILTGTDGPFDNVIKSKPPLCFTKQNVDLVIDSIDSILKKGV